MTSATNTIKVTNKPSGEYLDRETGELRPLDRSTLKLMLKGWDIKKKIDALEKDLKDINDHFVQGYGAPTSLIMAGVCRVKVQARERVGIKDVTALQALLGAEFDDLVKTSLCHTPTQALQDMSSSADEPLAQPLRKLLTVGYAETISWEQI